MRAPVNAAPRQIGLAPDVWIIGGKFESDERFPRAARSMWQLARPLMEFHRVTQASHASTHLHRVLRPEDPPPAGALGATRPRRGSRGQTADIVGVFPPYATATAPHRFPDRDRRVAAGTSLAGLWSGGVTRSVTGGDGLMFLDHIVSECFAEP